jgi:integrase
MTLKRNPTDVPGCYSYLLADGSLRYGAVVDVRGAWGRERVQRRKEGFARLRDAKEWRLREQTEVLAGKTGAGGNRTFGWWVGEWLELRADDLEYHTRVNYRISLDHFSELFPMALNKITPADLESVMVKLRRKYKPGYAGQLRTRLSICLGAAVRFGLIAQNPAKGTTPIRPDRASRVVWDAETIKRILDATKDDERWGLVFRLLAESWMRVGEACGLRWGDVDLDGGTVRVARTMRPSESGWVVGERTKTPSGARTIYISTQLVTMLRAWKDRQRFQKADTGLVIDRTPGGVRFHLDRLCADLEIAHAGPHMFRHAGITMAMRAGLDPRIVQQKAGHSNVSFTMQRYYWPNSEDHREMADRIAKLLG